MAKAKCLVGVWKRSEKEEQAERRRREKEAVDRVRAENEKREETRQRRKLEFLIAQTELYSHLVGKRDRNPSLRANPVVVVY